MTAPTKSFVHPLLADKPLLSALKPHEKDARIRALETALATSHETVTEAVAGIRRMRSGIVDIRTRLGVKVEEHRGLGGAA